MRSVWCISALLVLLIVTGCGGGGGNSSTASVSNQLSSNMVGTWNVEGLALPNNQLVVQSDGDVLVYSEASGRSTTSSASQTSATIGTCDQSGVLNLNGSWCYQNTDYDISATGRVDSSSQSLSLTATVRNSDHVIYDGTEVDGTRLSADEYPPGPPEL